MSLFFTCDPCAIAGKCLDGCGITLWGLLCFVLFITIIILILGDVIRRNKK